MNLVHLPPYRVNLDAPRALQNGVDWGVCSYGIPALWQRSQGDGVTVAVIDSGVAPHKALDSAVVDYRNFTSDSDAHDTLGHGTHVSGIIAARSGLAKGIAPGTRILSLKVLGHSGMGSNEWVEQAIRYATEAKVQIICMSLGSSRANEGVHNAIRDAAAAGVIVVCAAGNDGEAVNYPAAFPETIAVGAVDNKGLACEFSSRGAQIAVAAPGQDITSCWLANGYATVSGTSMAAPFVAGVLALYVSAEHKLNRKVTHADVMKALAQTCKDVGEQGHDHVYGWGLVDPHKLMNYTLQANIGGVTIFIPGAKVL